MPTRLRARVATMPSPAPLRQRAWLALALLSLLALLASGAWSTLPAQERHVIGGGSANIWNLAGEVRLEPGTGSDVVVEVSRGGRDAGKLEVRLRGSDLVVRYPDDEIVYREGRMGRSSSTLTVNGDGTFGGDRWAGRRTRVATYGDGLEAHADLVVRVPQGRRVTLHLAVGEVVANGVDGDVTIDVYSAGVRASGSKGRLMIDAGSGEVRVSDASGDLEVDTGSGATVLENLDMSRVMVDAGSGAVEARRVKAARFAVDVGSGSVYADQLDTDDLFVDTGSGSVRLDLTKVPGRSDIDTGSGGVTLTLPGNAAADLDIDTGSGGISSAFPVTTSSMERRSLRGRIGDGGPLIRVSTGSGGVRLAKR